MGDEDKGDRPDWPGDDVLRAAVERRFLGQLTPLKPGDVLSGRYRVGREIGRGGMGAVYEATQLVTDKRVAIKWLFPSGTRAVELRARFLREARAAARAKHPNIVDVYEIAEHGGGIYLVMELLEGQTLRERMNQGVMGTREAVSLLMPALRGLAAAHEQGVVHRDLKPDNIFLCGRGRGVIPEAKVLDFGISKLYEQSSGHPLTLDGAVLGTPHYMAPEQARGEARIDARADVYSIAVILYEAVSGRRPFLALPPPRLLKALTQEDPTPLRSHAPQLPEELEAIVMKALARNRDRRQQSMEELAHELEPLGRVSFAAGPRISSMTDDLRPVKRARDSAVPEPPVDTAVGLPRPKTLRYVALGLLAVAAGLAWLVAGRPAPPAKTKAGERATSQSTARPAVVRRRAEAEPREPLDTPATTERSAAPVPGAAEETTARGRRLAGQRAPKARPRRRDHRAHANDLVYPATARPDLDTPGRVPAVEAPEPTPALSPAAKPVEPVAPQGSAQRVPALDARE